MARTTARTPEASARRGAHHLTGRHLDARRDRQYVEEGREPERTGMEDVRIILAGLWVALMLTYLLGDVLRVFAGDFTPGEIDGQTATSWMWVLAALVMLVPITMTVLSLTLPYPAVRWTGIVASVFLVLFNVVGLPYPGVYDNVLIAVGFVFNGLVVWYSWRW